VTVVTSLVRRKFGKTFAVPAVFLKPILNYFVSLCYSILSFPAIFFLVIFFLGG